MAGMLPGVEMYRRRRRTQTQQHLHADTLTSSRSILQPSTTTTTTTTTTDQAALKARQRLEEKLGYLRPSTSRLNRIQANEGRGNNMLSMRDNHNHDDLDLRALGRRWHFHNFNIQFHCFHFHFHFHINSSSKSKGQLCAICLEDFHTKRQVMELSCSHKYHSECLLPWLADHPNCPSCRTPVQ